MEHRKPDRRAARTRAALHKALVDLIAEKNYDAITVEELAARADLGRATFYLHYRDKDDLLISYFTDFVAELVVQFSQVPLSILSHLPQTAAPGFSDILNVEFLPFQPILEVYRHAAENAPLYRIVLRGGGTSRVAGELQRVVTDSINEMLRLKVQSELGELQILVDIELLVHTFVGAFLAGLTWWLDRGMPVSPEEMARQFRILIFPGMRQALNISSK